MEILEGGYVKIRDSLKSGGLFMAEKNLTETDNTVKQRKDLKFLQALTLVALPLLWIGCLYSIYRGNNQNVSSYSCVIIAFSLMNFNALVGTKKLENKVLNILAKVDGILFFAWAVILIVSTILK